jgi:hypothetical protein
MVINTLGWVEGLGYELLLYVVRAIKVGAGAGQGRGVLGRRGACRAATPQSAGAAAEGRAAHGLLAKRRRGLVITSPPPPPTATPQADVVVVMEQDRLYNQVKSALAGEAGSMGRPLQVRAARAALGTIPGPFCSAQRPGFPTHDPAPRPAPHPNPKPTPPRPTPHTPPHPPPPGRQARQVGRHRRAHHAGAQGRARRARARVLLRPRRLAAAARADGDGGAAAALQNRWATDGAAGAGRRGGRVRRGGRPALEAARPVRPKGVLAPAAPGRACESPRAPCSAPPLRPGGGFRAPSSALPLGATSKADPLKVAPLAAGPELTHSLLAVSHATTPDQLPASNVAGFVLITNVDSGRGVVSYLAPCGGPLPGRYLLAGSLKAFLD